MHGRPSTRGRSGEGSAYAAAGGHRKRSHPGLGAVDAANDHLPLVEQLLPGPAHVGLITARTRREARQTQTRR